METLTNVAPELAAALNSRGFKTLTPVQEAVLQTETFGRDAIVSAQTGSGKTVAFGLSISSLVLTAANDNSSENFPTALIIAPTRELALQVKTELEWLYANTRVSISSCVGGMDMRAERRNLSQNPTIILGTPGRLKDHIERGFLNLSMLKVAVLDEADEMLKLGFRDELEFILGSTPKNRTTILFSATISKGIEKLAERYQRNALRISTINKNEQHLDIQYRAVLAPSRDQEHGIMNVLRYYDAKNALVFCGTRATVNHLTTRLNNRGFSVVSLSGELSQKERTSALKSMREGRSKVCVATDVAARGIDLPNLELVIHADLPKNQESLLHRSGRTGRAGKKGISILMVEPNAKRKVDRLLENAQIKATWEVPPKPDEILNRDNDRLLEDPIFKKIPTEEEEGLISSIIEKHSPEKIAGALVQMYRKDKFAPDEISDFNQGNDRKAVSSNFVGDNPTWIKLSVGHNQKADPGQLLATLIKVGKINKRDIGEIKISKNETNIEINQKALAKIMQSVGKNNELEKGININTINKNSEKSQPEDPTPLAGNSKQRRIHRRARERDNNSKTDDHRKEVETREVKNNKIIKKRSSARSPSSKGKVKPPLKSQNQ